MLNILNFNINYYCQMFQKRIKHINFIDFRKYSKQFVFLYIWKTIFDTYFFERTRHMIFHDFEKSSKQLVFLYY